MLVGIWGAAQTALLGPEGEAFLQQLGQVHELRSHCCYGMKHSASVLVQDRISVLMLLWRHPMVRQSSTLYVCVFMCVLLGMARAGCGKDRQKDAWRDKSSRLSPRHYQRRLLCGSEQVSLCMYMFYWMDGQLDGWMLNCFSCAGMWSMAVIQLTVLRERSRCGSRIMSCSAGKSAVSTGSMPESRHVTLMHSS